MVGEASGDGEDDETVEEVVVSDVEPLDDDDDDSSLPDSGFRCSQIVSKFSQLLGGQNGTIVRNILWK